MKLVYIVISYKCSYNLIPGSHWIELDLYYLVYSYYTTLMHERLFKQLGFLYFTDHATSF